MKFRPSKRVHRLADPVEVEGRLIERIAVRHATEGDKRMVLILSNADIDPSPDFAWMAVAMELLCSDPEALPSLSAADMTAVAELVASTVSGDF
jgi:hypothetical protein